jgi:hypothetical protein
VPSDPFRQLLFSAHVQRPCQWEIESPADTLERTYALSRYCVVVHRQQFVELPKLACIPPEGGMQNRKKRWRIRRRNLQFWKMTAMRDLVNALCEATDPPRNPPTGLFCTGSVPTDGAGDSAEFRRI